MEGGRNGCGDEDGVDDGQIGLKTLWVSRRFHCLAKGLKVGSGFPQKRYPPHSSPADTQKRKINLLLLVLQTLDF